MMNLAQYQDRMNDPALKKHLSDPRFKVLVAAASSSVREFFEIIQQESSRFPDHGETLVRKARLVLAFRVEEDAGEEHVIDLKTGPMPILKTQERTGSDDPFDMIVSVDTKKRFIGLMTQEEDGLTAYKNGAIRLVKGSMRAFLKLRSLQELADRWKEDLGFADAGGAAPAGETSMMISAVGSAEDEHMYQGYLDKQSDWLKKWNSRFVVLKWNEKARPQLRFFSSQAASRTSPARHFVELHSGMECISSGIPGEPLSFSLVDRRAAGRVLFVLRAPSERSMREWLNAFQEAITCRTRALETARRRLAGDGQAPAAGEVSGVKGPSGGLLDLLLATQRVCTSHSEQLRQAEEERRRARENIARLESRAQEAEEFLIYSTIEDDFTTLRKYFGWKFVPLCALIVYITKRMAETLRNKTIDMASWLGSVLHGHVLPRFITSRFESFSLGSLALVGLASAWAKHVAESKSWELSRRRWRVNALAIRAIWRLKLASIKADHLPPIHASAMWNVEFRTNAERLYLLALELRGLWVKSAQFLGARPDVVPEAALHVLKRLHDAVPATPFSEVKQLVETELNAPLSKHFGSFEESVLASASIGQVHVAHLLDGTKCVVKAQHPNVEQKIRQDLKNMETIVGWVEIIEPDFEAMPMVQEWTREVSKELEFDKEAENMLDVGRNLASDPSVYAALPMPIKGLYTKRVLVMHFVPGAKVNDLDNLRRVSGVDTEQQRSNLAMDICNAFARQLFVDGIFQADAHPGNILVAARSSVDPKSVQHLPSPPADDPDRALPILLDFGLTKRLPESKRLAFSRLICAMQNLDIGQLLLSFDEMGLRLKREDPFEDLSELRFAFRETESATESRAATLEHVMKAKEKYENLPRDQRNPVEAFPTEIMLFFRTVFLLRGLCTSLNVRVKYLKTMSAWARRALKEASLAKSSASSPITDIMDHSSLMTSSMVSSHDLVSRLKQKCEEIGGVGIQVHCLRFSPSSTFTMADLAIGRLHEVDFRPISNETLFPCLSLAQGVAQIFGRAVLEGNMHLKVKDIWPDFTNKELTIEALLRGDMTNMAGLPLTSLPPKFSVATMHKWQDHLAFVKDLLPVVEEEESNNNGQANQQQALPWEMSTLAFCWGWILAGTIQAMKPKKEAEPDVCVYEETFANQVAPRLGTNGGILVRAPDSELPLPAPKKGMSPAEEEEITAKRSAHRDAVNAKYAQLSIDLEKMSGGAVDLDKMWDLQSAAEMPSGGGGGGPGGFDFGSIMRSLGPSFKGKEYLVDPRSMNTISARSSLAPSCNLLSTAKSLARLFAAVGNGGSLDGKQVISSSVSEYFSKEFLLHESVAAIEPLGERLGMKVFEFKAASDGQVIRGFGQVAFGGSLVLCIPSLGLSLAILVNELTLERDLPRAIVEEVVKEIGLRLVSEI